jgi:biotin operon repressor
MKKIFPYLATVVGVFLFVILVNSDIVKAIDSFPKGPHHKIMEQLTEEQQKEVKAKMQDLWDSGASREEIHTEVTTMLNNFGIEIPEDFKGFRGKRGHRHGRGFMNFSDQLSEEQREAIKDKVEALREEGVSREEIHKEVTNMLQEYGIKIPEAFKGSRGKRGHRPGRGFMHFSDELNDEQREAILEKAKSMHEQGASREEIHAEIGNMLKDFGIDLPEEVGKHREMMENLDDEQRKVIRAKMREMRKEGASREEIREEMNKMFRDFDPNKSDDQINQSLETSGETLSIRSYPNPFNPETNIEYQIKSATEILITIYDVQGKRVKSLADDYRQAGTYTIKWNGLNESGIQVPSVGAGPQTCPNIQKFNPSIYLI